MSYLMCKKAIKEKKQTKNKKMVCKSGMEKSQKWILKCVKLAKTMVLEKQFSSGMSKLQRLSKKRLL